MSSSNGGRSFVARIKWRAIQLFIDQQQQHHF
jgi:hypothetical protein